jgi:hypothetical protein
VEAPTFGGPLVASTHIYKNLKMPHDVMWQAPIQNPYLGYFVTGSTHLVSCQA